MTVDEVLTKYSTPGLRKNQLSRSAKRDHLIEVYKATLTPEEREQLLDKLYPMLERLVPRMP